jgi:serine protease Do
MNFSEEARSSRLDTVLISAAVSTAVFILGSLIIYGGMDFGAGGDEGATNGDLSMIDEETRIVEIVEDANPAVVSIVVSKDLPDVRQFGPFSIQVPGGGGEQQIGGGSGFFISNDGLVMTNKHVVSDEEANYSVITSEGGEFPAEVVDRDPFNDLAVLRVSGGGDFTYLEFETGELKLGQMVIAIGNALGEFANSVSVGVVSGLSRSIVASGLLGQTELLDEVIQTDAAINPGNSGGPLLNINGKVVGVNVAVARGSENIGFALPAGLASQVAKSVKERGEIIRPYLGVRYVELNERIAEDADLPVSEGAYVIGGGEIGSPVVQPDSPASRAGIREGDIIVSIDGEEVTPQNSLAKIIRNKQVGDNVNLEIIRGERRMNLEATLDRVSDEL